MLFVLLFTLDLLLVIARRNTHRYNITQSHSFPKPNSQFFLCIHVYIQKVANGRNCLLLRVTPSSRAYRHDPLRVLFVEYQSQQRLTTIVHAQYRQRRCNLRLTPLPHPYKCFLPLQKGVHLFLRQSHGLRVLPLHAQQTPHGVEAQIEQVLLVREQVDGLEEGAETVQAVDQVHEALPVTELQLHLLPVALRQREQVAAELVALRMMQPTRSHLLLEELLVLLHARVRQQLLHGGRRRQRRRHLALLIVVDHL